MKKKNKTFVRGLNPRNPLHRGFNYMLLILLTIIVFLPMIIVFLVSFKTNQEYMTTDFLTLPHSFFNFDNYINFIKKAKLGVALRNEIILIVIPTFATVVFGSMVAYVVTRFDFKMKKYVLLGFIIASLIPPITVQVAQFQVIKALGLFNTIFAGLLIYSSAGVVEIYIFIQQMEKIPKSLDEAALVEGATYFQIYRKIIFPLMKPAIATVTILRSIYIYNDMIMPYLIMPGRNLRTIVTAFLNFTYDRVSMWNIMGAGITAIMLPIVILYIFIQRFIFSGITSGAVKD
jgi:multiple sugar transport system permease protein